MTRKELMLLIVLAAMNFTNIMDFMIYDAALPGIAFATMLD